MWCILDVIFTHLLAFMETLSWILYAVLDLIGHTNIGVISGNERNIA